ncbi:MAG: hypothetical protein HPY59_16355 [Anaerolineae bacterium]|nr:hypothetical protein [Anaerolineae bacterium]
MTVAIKGISLFMLLLIILALVALMIPALINLVQQMPDVSHAVAKHGTDAYYARECRDGWELRMYNPQTQRTGFICMTSAGKFGIVILDRFGEEVTAFLRDKNKTLEQVIRYMRNRGYELLQ